MKNNFLLFTGIGRVRYVCGKCAGHVIRLTKACMHSLKGWVLKPISWRHIFTNDVITWRQGRRPFRVLSSFLSAWTFYRRLCRWTVSLWCESEDARSVSCDTWTDGSRSYTCESRRIHSRRSSNLGINDSINNKEHVILQAKKKLQNFVQQT